MNGSFIRRTDHSRFNPLMVNGEHHPYCYNQYCRNLSSLEAPVVSSCQAERLRSADKLQPITGRGGIEPPNCGAQRVVKVLIVEYPRGEQGRLRLYNAE